MMHRNLLGLSMTIALVGGLALLWPSGARAQCSAGTPVVEGCDGFTYEGCCTEAGALYWCENGWICTIDCAFYGVSCGWNAQGGFYDCDQTGADPSGQYPIECPTCEPDCSGKQCGNGGCPLQPDACGKCQEGYFCNADFQCQECTCGDKVCGANECGLPCGTCPEGQACILSTGQCTAEVPNECIPKDTPGCPHCECEACVCAKDSWCCKNEWDFICVMECEKDCGGPPCSDYCFPDCEGKVCGNDGCGGTCGSCAAGFFCNDDGQCEECSCGDKTCGKDQCGNSCGECKENEFCDPTGHCQPCTCEGKECGDDGCGHSCGTCPEGKNCVNGKCVGTQYPDQCYGLSKPSAPTCAAIPGLPYEGCCDEQGRLVWCEKGQLWCLDCANLNPQCGWSIEAGFYDCGTNGSPDPSGQHPIECVFPPCVPDCTGKMCGDGGCPDQPNACGTCPEGFACNEGKCIPAGCNGITYEGCCDGAVVKWCENDQIQSIDCSQNQPPNNVCGWKKDAGFYDCGGQGPDPSGQNPLECPQICVPDCTNAQCGNGGCEGYPETLCGACGQNETCENGKCAATCVPNCQDKDCGDDGCGGSCGTCEENETCVNGKCEATCVPNCEGKECGDDGCNGSCGTCEAGEVCVEGKCCAPNCQGKECGDDGCGGSCGTCPAGQVCSAQGTCVCQPNCQGKECGDDGCGGSCGECGVGAECVSGHCQSISPPDQVQDASGGDLPTDKGQGGGGGGGGCMATGPVATPWPFLVLLSGLGAALISRRRK